jgi:hypothetical protein
MSACLRDHHSHTPHGGMAATGASAAGPRFGLHGELVGCSGVALSKVGKNISSPCDATMVRGWRWASKEVLDDGEGAPVAGDDRR